jgi:hypothetical protein
LHVRGFLADERDLVGKGVCDSLLCLVMGFEVESSEGVGGVSVGGVGVCDRRRVAGTVFF